MLTSPRILSEDLVPPAEPLTLLVRPGDEAPAATVACRAARALLGLADAAPADWPAWLARHQRLAAERVAAILSRYGGALLADAVGLGKSYVALAVALAGGEPFALVVPAVLVPQWRALLARYEVAARIVTHEALSTRTARPRAAGSPLGSAGPPATGRESFRARLFVVDEAHRFRNPGTNRYRALAQLVVGARVLLVTATPVHNRVADLFHLFRLFLRDHDLAALGVSSVRRAARGDIEGATLAAVAARLTVARSRQRVRMGYEGGPLTPSFPNRASGERIRIGAAPEPLLAECVQGIRRLTSGGPAAPLLRVTLLRRLASSLPAFRASLERHEAFLELALAAAREGRALEPREFRRLLLPGDAADVQLALFPLLLAPGTTLARAEDLAAVRRLRTLARNAGDRKAEALARLLRERGGKTIVFTDAIPTVRHLLRTLDGLRVAAVVGETGLFAAGSGPRAEVLRAFAPLAQRAPAPPAALQTDVLIATDLLSEGLNLQDAARVIHYDLPWSPARLAQRAGRVDRLGSPHRSIEIVTFLPPPVIERALALEERLAVKVSAQAAAGAAEVESVDAGPLVSGEGEGELDWCDRLHALERAGSAPAPDGACAAVAGTEDAVVLVVRIGALVEALVVSDRDAGADPRRAAALLERAVTAASHPLDRPTIEAALRRAAPLLRARLEAVAGARWRAADRDRLARRLLPWVLAAASRAARRRDARELARLDALVSRLALGMTAGEELLLEDLLGRRTPLAVGDLLAWHERLPPVREPTDAPRVALVAAVEIRAEARGRP